MLKQIAIPNKAEDIDKLISPAASDKRKQEAEVKRAQYDKQAMRRFKRDITQGKQAEADD